jgi:pullulanase
VVAAGFDVASFEHFEKIPESSVKRLLSALFIFSAAFCLLAFSARPNTVLGPARALWLSSSEIRFKTPLTTGPDQRFLLKTSEREVLLDYKSSHSGTVSLGVPFLSNADLQKLISGDLKFVVLDSQGRIIDQTSVQWAGLLDEKFARADVSLGPDWSFSPSRISVWAPTARVVELALYESADQDPDSPSQILSLKNDAGFWSGRISDSEKGKWYLFKINLYNPRAREFKTYYVTDPYSRNLSVNSKKSQLIDLTDKAFQPPGWQNLRKPHLDSFKDIVIYETHLRDLTGDDHGVPENLRGTYLSLLQSSSLAAQHLRELAESGLTHIHFLPFTDFATVNEDKSHWAPWPVSPGVWKDSPFPQSELEKIRALDSYNWGYDPVHWMAPEGSYSAGLTPEARVTELRQMISFLNKIGLRVVMDLVFNHTYASGDEDLSVLDKIVPYYYYRYDDEGNPELSSCCADTASENKMMEKLMVDAVVFWATEYKIDGFRFDLMSFHSRSTMEKIRDRVRALTLHQEGVDGSKIYLYGEGWEFGSLFDSRPQEAMTQLNSFGAGIGSFNDRFRDALRGGTTDSREKSDQGFLTGLYFDFNQEPANRNTPIERAEQKEKLYELQDVIKVGLAGNLRDYSLKNHLGMTVRGSEVLFHGKPTGYAETSIETVNYISAHDGYSLWDAIQAKSPFHTPGRDPGVCTIYEKRRMQGLALGSVLLSQGVAFIEGGSELLRSKSGDSDSFDSGDWFNALHWDFLSNNWGQGLPPSWRNKDDWSFWSPRLQDPLLIVSQNDILQTKNYFKALLNLRRRLSDWRFESVSDLQKYTEFLNNDQGSSPSLIAFLVKGPGAQKLLIINGDSQKQVFSHPSLSITDWTVAAELVQADPEAASVKVERGGVSIPARTLILLEEDL